MGLPVAAMNIGVQVSESLLSFLLDMYLEVKLLDHMVILCLPYLFSMAAAPFSIPTSSAQGFQLLHVLTDGLKQF